MNCTGNMCLQIVVTEIKFIFDIDELNIDERESFSEIINSRKKNDIDIYVKRKAREI